VKRSALADCEASMARRSLTSTIMIRRRPRARRRASRTLIGSPRISPILRRAGMASAAKALCAADPERACIGLDGPDRFDGGGPGRQWFSVAGVTPNNRAARVAAVLPCLAERLYALTAAEGLAPRDLTVLGFSQGAILTLALAASGFGFGHGVALAGRLAVPVQPASTASPRLWLGHGEADAVIPPSEGRDAEQRLVAAGYDAVFRPMDGHGHAIAPEQLVGAQLWLAADTVPRVPLNEAPYPMRRNLEDHDHARRSR